MIFAKPLQRGDQRSRIARGAQAQVELVGVALARARFEDRDQLLRDSRRDLAAAAGDFGAIVIDENQIEVGVVRHLARAEPAHRNRAQAHRGGNREARRGLNSREHQRLVQHRFGQTS